MDKLNLNRDNLRKFGITMGVAFLVITLIILIRHKQSTLSTSMVSAVFFILAMTTPIVLKPIYILWMKLAFVLGWINTRLILFVLFYLVFSPIAMVVRLFGSDLLDRRIEKKKKSYWIQKVKKEFNPADYERQF